MAEPDKNSDQITLGPWPKGVNNRHSEHELPEGTLRTAINVDITNTGRVRRRVGRTAVVSGAGYHSVFGHKDKFLFMRNGLLYLGLPPSHTQIASWSDRPVAYVEVNDEIYISNGAQTAKLTSAGVLRTWGVERPATQPTLAAVAFGGMYAGRYQVAVTFVDDTGEEGGSQLAQVVDVAEGGGIAVTAIPQPVSNTVGAINIYLSGPNDDKRFLWSALAVDTTSVNISRSDDMGRAHSTMDLDVFPPCDILEYYNGRIYGAARGGIVWYTDPLRYGAIRYATNFLLFPAEVDVIKATEDGIYVCADKTYWHDGAGPEQFKPVARLPFGAVRGTGVKMGNSQDVAWFSKNGWVIGKPGGKVEQVMDANVVVSEYNSGVGLFREDRGLRQLVSALRGPTTSTFRATDSAEAEVIRAK